MTTRRLTRSAVLTAVALTIYMIELQIPSLVPIPGVKLGLANIVTVFAMFLLGPADTAAILLCRILLGGIFSGQLMALVYSLTGGALCYLVMLIMRRLVTERQIWVCSVAGAAAHNAGQMAAAIAVTATPALIVYLPVLMVSGIIAGLFTGLCAQFAMNRMQRLFPARRGKNKDFTLAGQAKINKDLKHKEEKTMEQKFYICEHCGNIIAKVKDAGVPVMCCGQKMTEIVPGTTEAATEKHIPVYTVENNIVTVRVGSVDHPMLPEHYIEWVSLQTKQGNQRKTLKPGDAPTVQFAICDGDEIEAVYAYCNLHSLWKA